MSRFAKYFMPSCVAALSVAAWSSTAVAANEVQLQKVNSIYSSYKGPWLRGSFEAIVVNSAYAKQVSIHYKKTTGSWGNFPLSYNRSAGAGKELWSAPFSNTSSSINLPDAPAIIEFAVKYQVNGMTYWDNNGGANYKIAQDSGTILPTSNVYNAAFSPNVANTNTVSGSVTVRNLAPQKSVFVKYTTNNWATFNTVAATYNPSFWASAYSSASNPNAYGFEEWSYAIPVGNTATNVKYVIGYTVNGQTYWDNNFGNNYSTTIAR